MGTNSDVTVRLSAEGREQLIAALRSIGPEGEAMANRLTKSGTEASRGLLAINAAAEQVKDKAGEFASELGPLGSVMRAIGPTGLALAASLGAVGLAVEKAFDKAKEGMEFADSVNTASRSLHIGVEALQEYRAAFTVVGDETANFDAALSSLLQKMGEFDRTGGGGKAGGAFKALGLSVRDANGEMKTGEQMLAEVIDKVSALGSAAQQADISKKLFGDQASNFLALIQNGSKGVDELREKMRAMGVVMDADVVRRYAEASEQSKILSKAIDVQLMTAFVDFAPVLNDAASAWAWFASKVREARDALSDVEQKSTTGLEAQLAGNLEERNSLEVQLQKLQKAQGAGVTGLQGQAQGAIKQRISDLDAESARISDILQQRAKLNTPPPNAGDNLAPGISENAKRDIDAIQKLRDEIANFGNERQKAIDTALAGLSDDATAKTKQTVTDLAGRIYDLTQMRKDDTEAIQKEQEALKDGENIRQSILTDTEKLAEALSHLKERLDEGVISQDTYDRAIKKAKEDYDPATKAIKKMSDGVADASVELLSSIGSFHDAGEAVKDFTQKILELILQTVVWQPIQSALSSGLSSMFSGAFGSSGAAVNHTGGMSGHTAPSRMVSSAVFAGAPRFHGGGMPGLAANEVPTITTVGEGIFTPRQMDNADALFRAMAGLAGGGRGNVTVNITKNADKDDVKTSTGTDGSLTVDVLIAQAEAKMAGRIGAGRSPINAAVERRYGLNAGANLQRRGGG